MSRDRGTVGTSRESGHLRLDQSRDNDDFVSEPRNARQDQPFDLEAVDGIIEEQRQRSGSAEPWGCQSELGKFLAEDAVKGRNFTARGVIVGLIVGILICFSNTFFGLQTGWISGMTMPASLIGFAFFKTFARSLSYPFSPVENVLVQTVATSVGTMPLGSGFVGVIPALEYLLAPAENGPLKLGLGKLIVWSLGLSFFGVVFGVPLRKQVIIREELRFPSGTATALMIGVLHGRAEKTTAKNVDANCEADGSDEVLSSARTPLVSQQSTREPGASALFEGDSQVEEAAETEKANNWKSHIRLLVISFAVSSTYTLITYFVPQFRNIPFLGTYLASTWLWTFNLSPAYAAQGIIMGPATTFHMLVGAIVGWGMLSPLAKNRGWAPGPVKDWETGSKGWIVWISLAIMLVDSIISIGWLAARPLARLAGRRLGPFARAMERNGVRGAVSVLRQRSGYTALVDGSEDDTLSLVRQQSSRRGHALDTSRPRASIASGERGANSHRYVDAPPDQLISSRTVTFGLVLSLLFCVVTIRIGFGPLVPIYATVMAVVMALLLSIMGVRALGQTDLNPVSGISKLTQLVFALVIPRSNKNAVLINLVGGAVSEAGALQAGDMLQDLKTGHLLAASPKAQFHGQLIGSFVGAIASAAVYKLYTSVYPVPGDLFPVPTGYVWIYTARLVTGQGLAPMASEYALGAAILFAGLSGLRIAAADRWWRDYVPGGIAVAVGMYNAPSFTLARAVGGFISWYFLSLRNRASTTGFPTPSGRAMHRQPCTRTTSYTTTTAPPTSRQTNDHEDGPDDSDVIEAAAAAEENSNKINDNSNDNDNDHYDEPHRPSKPVDADMNTKDSRTEIGRGQTEETTLIILASGLILGEGVMSIVNLVLASYGVGHL